MEAHVCCADGRGRGVVLVLRGEAPWPRKEFIYWTDDGSVAALRYGNWKITFLKQDALGLRVWQEPFTVLRAPLITNLRMDPFERAEEENAMGFQRWYMERMFLIAPAGAYVAAVPTYVGGFMTLPFSSLIRLPSTNLLILER